MLQNCNSKSKRDRMCEECWYQYKVLVRLVITTPMCSHVLQPVFLLYGFLWCSWCILIFYNFVQYLICRLIILTSCYNVWLLVCVICIWCRNSLPTCPMQMEILILTTVALRAANLTIESRPNSLSFISQPITYIHDKTFLALSQILCRIKTLSLAHYFVIQYNCKCSGCLEAFSTQGIVNTEILNSHTISRL